jgi:uncharacterized ferritin-like protein (DUF455 family)
MRKFLPVDDLARDERFNKLTMADRMADPRTALGKGDEGSRRASNRLVPSRPDASAAARGLMHGIFVGEIQALEGAGRTCHDFRTQGDQARRAQDATGDNTGAAADCTDAVPFALKLDMARQAWDEARHVEISIKLSEWMGTELGEFAENTVLFQAACSTDPILRLAGVNRALEGLAIDVFTTMKEFGELAGDPYLEFAEGTTLYQAACNADPVLRLTGVNRALEGLAIDVFTTMRDLGTSLTDPVLTFSEDWMLADEVTHVKMGSDWLRRVTENDPERRKKALEFQGVVDKLFSYGGTRSDSQESPIGLARRFRDLAGFTDAEVESIAEVSLAALEERKAAVAKMQQAADAVAELADA